ncbi:hypothetical protein MSG28_016024 [Choristoneura fumiferana]|uniref:Uncharacterized protein n=1 Tax=Choristoneura fumiferana TaxID=7141 RepID=A0ACC0K5J2_CHOFU|nr:hypothetical protein MSG28_016024 [Choristoneura fumiferana]
MDSFCSLFDPSDGHQGKSRKKQNKELDNVKKKADAPKGRRRGRKGQGKNETLPEESSFLCEPHLSSELLVKDGSYIDCYIEVNKDPAKDEETKTDDKKPKRRNSGRKNRRWKKSPPKDEDTDQPTNWNNQSSVQKICTDIGKNVNDLNDYKKSRRKDLQDGEVLNVIDKLEKVILKDDTYLAGDFNAEDLDNEAWYSSDDLEESLDDTGSEGDESGDEATGSLPPEPRFGNVEYKLQLVSPCERRFQHLVTQLKWRLRSGGGSAVYLVGVRDCGALRGLRPRALRGSLHTLRRMALALRAQLAHVTARRVRPQRAVAEVYIRQLADTQQSVELRVAVMGANEAGKSTLIGVLTQGELDNGRGSARLNMFRHLHEVKSGRTSSLSHEILGFDAQGNVVNYGCSELMTAERIGERSAKLVSFLDLAGHSKYQRTTLHGLTGYSPHHAMLVISATAGITRITEEHIGLLLALDLPFFAVVSKCELAPAGVPALVQGLAAILEKANKKPLLITDENLARNCVGPQKLILDTIDGIDNTEQKDEEAPLEQVPVFPVSCVRGAGLNALHAYLLALQPPARAPPPQPQPAAESVEFQIDEIFHVGDSSGPVVGGLLARGQLYEGDNLIIGMRGRQPQVPAEACIVLFSNMTRNKIKKKTRNEAGGTLVWSPCCVAAGGGCGRWCWSWAACVSQSARSNKRRSHCRPAACKRARRPVGLARLSRAPRLRPGLVLLAAPRPPPRPHTGPRPRPAFGECARHCHAQVSLITSPKGAGLDLGQQYMIFLEQVNFPRQPKSNNQDKLYDAIADAVSVLAKPTDPGRGSNVVSDSDREDCGCPGRVLLEDPEDPRGCMYFQANIQVLRHSTAISPGFQCTVHCGNVRQTAIIEGIMSHNSSLRCGECAPALFRFARCPEHLVRGRRLLLAAGGGTRAIGRITQIFPYVP